MKYPSSFCNKAHWRDDIDGRKHSCDVCPAPMRRTAALMDRVFKVRAGLQAVVAPGIGVYFTGEADPVLVKGALFMRLCPLIDGRRSLQQLVEELQEQADPAEVIYGVDWLAARGLLALLDPHPDPVAADFWQAVGLNAELADADSGVELLALGQANAQPFAVALLQAGLRPGARGAARLVVTDDLLDPALAGINQSALHSGQPWLLARPGGAVSWVGPLFEPGQGPCWTCLATRLRANRPVQTYLQRRGLWPADTAPRLPALAVTHTLTAGTAALLLAQRARRTGPPASPAKLWALDHALLTSHPHPVLRRPNCTACGTSRAGAGAAAEASRVLLRPGLRRVAVDGGHRTTTPQVTFERLRDHISPVTGIVASLGPLPQRPALRPVYAASYLVCPVDDAPSADDFHRSALGKGQSAEQARASALCEALERWSAIAQGDEIHRRAAWQDIAFDAVRPVQLLNFSAAQYEGRGSTNRATPDVRRQVPLPPRDDLVIDWTAAWSLTYECVRYLPSAYCYSHLRVAPEEAICSFNPNGHAAGNGLEEAILQGFLELVERDSVALWWYSRALRPGVDLASFRDPYIDALLAHYAAMGWQLWALDISTDLEIPSFVGLARSVDGQGWCVGFGCHLAAPVALLRALTEVNQLFGLDPNRAVPWSQPLADGDDFLFPSSVMRARTMADYSGVQPDDLRDEVLTCVKRAQRLGLETLVLDLSRPDVALSVAKVVVPGLRHFWPRFGPGRLYDAPAALGWVPARLSEAQLNPAHLFL